MEKNMEKVAKFLVKTGNVDEIHVCIHGKKAVSVAESLAGNFCYSGISGMQIEAVAVDEDLVFVTLFPEMRKIVNLTSHTINFMEWDNTIIASIPSSGVARAAQHRQIVDTIVADGITLPIARYSYGDVQGLPDPMTDTIYIVSEIMAQAVLEREDVFIVEDDLLDENGCIIGRYIISNEQSSNRGRGEEYEEKEGNTMRKIVNLTPHTINFVGQDNTIVASIPSSGVARVVQSREIVDTVVANGITLPIARCTYGDVQGLPEPMDDTIYIVSAITAQAVPMRPDVFIVDDSVRDENGRIIGVRGLAHI